MQKQKVLLIDDDPSLLRVLDHQLTQAGYQVVTAKNLAEGTKAFENGNFDLVLSDLSMPDGTGIDLLNTVRQLSANVGFIIITAYGTVDNALEACRKGADDYLTKPFSREQLLFTIEKSLRTRSLVSENVQLHSELLKKFNFSAIIARSQPMHEVLKLVAKVAGTESTALILGESGTGKELIAQAIHYNSPRKKKPLITVNCPSIPDHLIESELFGHVKGAFTGAMRDHKGKFELAEGGSLFLDEIGDLKQELQAKLLRVLQQREIERVGGEKPIKVDVRIIAATNRNLEKFVQEGAFREDLYYRLSVFPILLPPLRSRKQDGPHLIQHFLSKSTLGRNLRIHPDALDLLLSYDWPGNVRELENVIERAAILAENNFITPENLPKLRTEAEISYTPYQPANEEDTTSLMEVEKKAIIAALEKTEGNQTAAAKALKIPRHVLIYRMKKLGLS
ncbi:MAG: sigma-54-dependent transcriptional regulator [bacterium]